ncbi:hypothetical protein WBJ53_26140 [Spirosoma sp. SC4-14]|uniref:hypothetical protein n=1 Tax=Spirosoma sp. SC4-14 TaxID=3128900 RepID=UPI0030D307B2
MALQTPPEIPTLDILRSVRMVVNTIIATLITDTELTDNGFKLKTSAGDELEVDLSSIFLKRGESDDITNLPFASETQTGRIAIVSDKEVTQQVDDTKAMTVAKTLLLLTTLGIPKFGDLVDGEMVQATVIDGTLTIKSIPKLDWINSLDADEIAAFCEKLSGCSGSNPQEPTLNLVIVNHYEEQAVVVENIPLKAALDDNTCNNISGWVSGGSYPPIARITCDGLTVGYQTATLDRPDVRDALNEEGANTTKALFGFNWLKPSTFMDGENHTWQVYVGDSDVEATDYNKPKEIQCGTPPNNDPYVVGYEQSILNSITKNGSSVIVSILEVLNTGEKRAYTGSTIPVWSVANTPAGIILTPNNANKTVSIVSSNATTVSSFKLECSLTQPQTVQVITVGCERPSGLTNYLLSWHFIPEGGYARLYSTLDDACATAGQSFDGTAPGNLDPFLAQAVNLNIGTPFFLGDGSSCEKVGNNIYYVLNAAGNNTILKAIQVDNGVIVAVKDSTYTSPTCTSHAKLTVAEHDALPTITIYEYRSASGIARAFASQQEAIDMVGTIGNAAGTNRANYDLNSCSDATPAVGSILYNDNRPEHTADNSNYLWPVEAGFWLWNVTSSTDFYVLETDACGNIITKTHITP